MKIQLYFFLIILFFLKNPVAAFAQSENTINDLKAELEKTVENTHKVDVYLKIALQYGDSTLVYAQQAMLLSDKLKYQYGSIKSRLIAGDYQRLKKELVSIDYFLEARELLQNYDDTTLEAWCYSSLARYYYHLKPILPEALKNAHKALHLYEKLEDFDNLMQTYTICGMIYSSQYENEDAIDYFNKATSMAEKTNDSASIAYISNCISNIYTSNSQYDEALTYNQKALAIYESLGDRGPVWGVAWTYAFIGHIYQIKANQALAEGNKIVARGLFEKAFHIYTKRIEIEREIKSRNNNSESMDSYLDLANWHIQMIQIGESPSIKNYTEIAETLLADCIRNAEEIKALGVLPSAYLSRSVLDSIRGDFRSAYENYSTFIHLSDSLTRQQKSEEALHLKMQYDFDKEQAIAKTNQEKTDIKQRTIRNSLVVGIAVLFFFSVIVLRQRHNVKKEKKRSDDLLLNILPSEIADELKERGNTQAKQYNDVSVLFTDFVNFTESAETLSPEQLVKELHECFTAFDNIIERNGLEKIKTIGDAYLAVCGLPVSNPQHAKLVVQAALEIRDFIRSRNLQKKTFQIRVGVHSGSVVAGIIGVKKFTYDIWGDTVNTAAQMENSGEAGKVNISEATYQLVKGDFTCEHRGKIEAKGKGEMNMYFVNKINNNHV